MSGNYRIVNSGYQHGVKQFSRAKGNFLYTQDDTPYIDMAMGAGSLILGHSHENVVAAVQTQSEQGSIFLQNNPCIQALSKKVSALLPSTLSNHIYCNTGSEATQRAVRLARATTGKTHIASFKGGWHGMNEWTLLDDGGRFGQSVIRADNGIPKGALDYSLLLPYNHEFAFDIIAKNAQDLAAVIIEPFQGSNPQPNIYPFLAALIEQCNQLGVLVIFDEIITGFRVCSGGAASLMALKPDIATYGKILGGGLPMGLVAFSEEVYAQSFADDNKQILTGGTFSANPISASAGLATLTQLNAQTYAHITALSDYFLQRLNHEFLTHNIEFCAGGVGSINRVYFTNKKISSREERDAAEISTAKQAKFREILFAEHIIWPPNGIVCMPASQEKSIIDHVVDKVIFAAKKIT